MVHDEHAAYYYQAICEGLEVFNSRSEEEDFVTPSMCNGNFVAVVGYQGVVVLDCANAAVLHNLYLLLSVYDFDGLEFVNYLYHNGAPTLVETVCNGPHEFADYSGQSSRSSFSSFNN